MEISQVTQKRTAGQKQVIVVMKDEFLDQIDARLEQCGFSDRASFIREAIYKELQRNGFSVPAEFKTAPSRAGKGGRRKKKE